MIETPADLTLVEQFLNTLDERTFTWHGQRRVPGDELTSAQALSAWLAARDLGQPGEEGEPAGLDTARALRAALRQSLAGGAPAGDLAPFALRLAPDGAGRLRLAADSGVPGLDVIVETVAASVADGSWKRLKLCAAPDCRWAFYDTSRNGGGRWCRMEACGNRSKTRAYRHRQAS